MAKLTASDLRKRKKEDLFIYGYYVNSASDLTSTVDVTQNKIDIYGEDDPITENTVNNGTLNVTVQDKATDITIQSLLTGQNPGATGAKRFYYETINTVCAWVNIKNSANTQYSGSILYDGWTPTPGLPAGGAGEKATRNYSGQCSIPKEFTKPITALKGTASSAAPWIANVTYSGAASGDLIENPSDAGNKALKCFAINAAGTIEEVKTTDATLTFSTPNWVITVAASELSSGFTPTSLYVVSLFDETKGVYPTAGVSLPHTIKT